MPLFVNICAHPLSIYDSMLSEGLDLHCEVDFGKDFRLC